MNPRVEFHFDFGSPNAYLSHRILPVIEARTGVPFEYVPVLLGGVFKATGNVSPAISQKGIKNKPEYMAIETRRFIERHGLADYKRNPHFPVNTLLIMRGAIAAEREGCFERYVSEIYRYMWSDPRKMDDPEIVRMSLEESDLPAAAILAATREPEIKTALIDNTNASVSRGVFGSPSFFVGEELFFGKDSLRDVEVEIEAQKERDRERA